MICCPCRSRKTITTTTTTMPTRCPAAWRRTNTWRRWWAPPRRPCWAAAGTWRAAAAAASPRPASAPSRPPSPGATIPPIPSREPWRALEHSPEVQVGSTPPPPSLLYLYGHQSFKTKLGEIFLTGPFAIIFFSRKVADPWLFSYDIDS